MLELWIKQVTNLSVSQSITLLLLVLFLIALYAISDFEEELRGKREQ